MEQLNSVILRGIIGNARIQTTGATEMARFSIATDHAFVHSFYINYKKYEI